MNAENKLFRSVKIEAIYPMLDAEVFFDVPCSARARILKVKKAGMS